MALSQALANRLWYNKPMGKIWDMNDEGKAKIKAYAQERYKNSSEVVSCANCNKQYKVAISRVALGRGKYCSRLCKGQYSRGKRVSVDTEFKKGQKPWNAGLRYSGSMKGANYPTWKGDLVGYDGLHRWVKRTYTFDDCCYHCGRTDKRLDLANITGVYGREKENWIKLCRGCHIKEDRINPKRPKYKLGKGWG